jgi:hypothetical protein
MLWRLPGACASAASGWQPQGRPRLGYRREPEACIISGGALPSWSGG